MGGYGSGGWNATGRPTTADVLCLDVNRLNRAGAFRGYFSGTLNWSGSKIWAEIHFNRTSNFLTLRSSGQTESFKIEWEACQFGGKRPYFRCPCCHDRTLYLYFITRMRCRKCHNLSYPSQRERESDRAQRKANRIRTQMGGEPGWLNVPTRPKGMHQRTYWRLVDQIHRADLVTAEFAKRRFGLVIAE